MNLHRCSRLQCLDSARLFPTWTSPGDHLLVLHPTLPALSSVAELAQLHIYRVGLASAYCCCSRYWPLYMPGCPPNEGACPLVAAMEPTLPVHPTLMSNSLNPCIIEDGASAQSPKCLPYVHIISGWHMFSDESLGWLKKLKAIETRTGLGCFDDWGENDDGGRKWVSSFGKPPPTDTVIMTHCNKLLTWYPAFAGRYTSAWGKAYGPCKTTEMANLPKGVDYYATKMWQVCRPRALAAHDKARGTGGAGKEATPPVVMKNVYGTRVRVISALRSPVDRLETSFWGHRHYPIHYPPEKGGLRSYIAEQGAAFNDCAATHGSRRCAHLVELLGEKYAAIFFHADQLIRGLYEPFIVDWHAAFGAESFLAVKVEALLDQPRETRAKVLEFLGLPGAPPSSVDSVAPLPSAPAHSSA